jgi:type IV pilus assembly protein PilB
VGRHLIGELLVNAKIITREQLEEALATPRQPGKRIGQVLLERGWLSEAQLTQTLSLQLGVPWVSLYHIDFSRQLLNRVPREMAERFNLIPIFVRHVKGQGETLYIATDDPKNEAALGEVARAAQLPTRPMIAAPADIRSAIRVYYFDGEQAPSTVPTPSEPSSVPSTVRERDRLDNKPQKPPVPVAAGAPPPPPAGSAPGRSISQPAPPLPTSKPQSQPPPGGIPGIPPEVKRPSGPPRARSASNPRMVALTLLDGTTLELPARGSNRPDAAPPSVSGVAESLTARDLISALRAVSHGADASEILGGTPQWEPVVAALLSVLLKKGVIADWEFIEEYRKI